jgi:uncharacterized protein YjbJ (UPF0337 family)
LRTNYFTLSTKQEKQLPDGHAPGAAGPLNYLYGRQAAIWHARCNASAVVPSWRAFYQSSNEELRMNWDRVEGNWKQMTGKVKQQWGKLTDDTLTQINGQRDQLVGKIQEAYGISRDEADRQVQEWEKLN